MTFENRCFIQLSDIVGIEQECTHCQARIFTAIKKIDRLAQTCPNCNEPLLKMGRGSDYEAITMLGKQIDDVCRRNLQGMRLEVKELPRHIE